MIKQAVATITVTHYSVPYNATAYTATGSATGIGGVSLGADLNLTGTTHTSAGTYANDSWSFTDPNGNYQSAGEGAIQNWWPGAAYVNWVGIDGYYYGKNYTFGNLFLPTMTTIRTFTKDPILIAETAAGQVAGQAAKISNLFSGASRNGVLGLVWFDLNQKGSYWKQQWRIEGHPTSVGTFKKDVKQYIK